MLLGVTAGLTYIDRLNLGIVTKYVQEEYKFDTETMGWILGAFSLGYAIFHIPGGWLADRFGPRKILAGAILWFSVFAGLTAIAPKLPVLGSFGAAWAFAMVRFGLGTGEAAAIPVGNKIMGYLAGAERAWVRNECISLRRRSRRGCRAYPHHLAYKELGLAMAFSSFCHCRRCRRGRLFFLRY